MLLAFFFACWIVVLLHYGGIVSLAGSLSLDLHALYGVAAAFGWAAGNLYVSRRSRVPEAVRRRLALIAFLGPPSVPALLRAMAPADWQLAAPLVPLWAFGVHTVFVCVPLVFGSRTAATRPPKSG